MRSVKFHKVGMKNYGPYIDPLEYTLNPNTLCLITGPNGIGKTISLDAFPYTLYGMRSNGAKGDDVVNNSVGKNCHTWTEFEVENDLYRVDRYRKHSKFGDTVILKKQIDGNFVETHKGQKDVLPVIERLTMPRKLFMNTLMFAQKVKDFFTDLTDSEKKEIFRKVLDLEIYLTYYAKAKERADSRVKELQEIDNDHVVQSKLLDEIKKSIEEQKERKKNYRKTKEEKISQIKSTIQGQENVLINTRPPLIATKGYADEEKKLQDLIANIASKKAEIDSITIAFNNQARAVTEAAQSKQSSLRLQASNSKAEIGNNMSSDIDKLKNEINEVNARYNQEKEKEQSNIHKEEIMITQLRNTIDRDENELIEYQKALDSDISVCPTCGQEIKSPEHIKEKHDIVIKRIEQNKGLIAKHIESKSIIKKELDSITTVYTDDVKHLNEELQKLMIEKQRRENEVEKRLNIAIAKVGELKDAKIVELKNLMDLEKQGQENEYNILLGEKVECEKVIRELKEFEAKIESIKRDIERLKYQLETVENDEFDDTQLKRYIQKESDIGYKMNELAAQKETVKRKQAIAEFWKKAYSPTGIPSMLIDDSIPFMNDKVNDYLEKMSNGRYIVSFDTLDETKAGEFRDKISVKVLDTKTKANKRVQFSGGQTRLVDVAILLTLGDLQASIQEVDFNLLLFDEIFDSLDDTNIGYVSKVMRKVTDGKVIFVVSHRHVDQLEADEVYNYS